MIDFTECNIVSVLNPQPYLCAHCVTTGKSHRLSPKNLKIRGLTAPFFYEAFHLSALEMSVAACG